MIRRRRRFFLLIGALPAGPPGPVPAGPPGPPGAPGPAGAFGSAGARTAARPTVARPFDGGTDARPGADGSGTPSAPNGSKPSDIPGAAASKSAGRTLARPTVARPPAAGGLTDATGTDAEPTDAEPTDAEPAAAAGTDTAPTDAEATEADPTEARPPARGPGGDIGPSPGRRCGGPTWPWLAEPGRPRPSYPRGSPEGYPPSGGYALRGGAYGSSSSYEVICHLAGRGPRCSQSPPGSPMSNAAGRPGIRHLGSPRRRPRDPVGSAPGDGAGDVPRDDVPVGGGAARCDAVAGAEDAAAAAASSSASAKPSRPSTYCSTRWFHPQPRQTSTT